MPVAPDFIKMDIENGELEALRGSLGVMQALKPRPAVAVCRELEDAAAAERLVRSARPDHRAAFRGAYGRGARTLKPHMLPAS